MTGTRQVALGDVCAMDRVSIAPDDPLAGKLPYVGVEHVESMTGTITSLDEGSRVGDGKSNTFRFDQRHVLYGKLRPYLNKVALPGFEGRSSTELVPLLPKPSLDRAYLAYLLRRAQTVDHVMSSVTGARMPRTDMNVLLSMPIPLPPIEEQRRIVDILNRAASIERLRRQAAAHLRDFIPALFLKMFGDPLENPMGWETKNIGRFLVQKPNYGTMARPSESAGAWLDLRVANLNSNGLDLSSKKWVDLPPKDVERHSLKDGDIILARAIGSRDHLGKCDVVFPGKEAWAFDSHLMRVRTDQRLVLPVYLVSLLRTPSGRALFMQNTRSSAIQFNINVGEFLAISVPVPPLDSQQAFARLVDATKARADLAYSASTLAVGLSQSLLDQMLGTDRS